MEDITMGIRHTKEMDKMITREGLLMADLTIPMIHRTDDSHCDNNNYEYLALSAMDVGYNGFKFSLWEFLEHYVKKNKKDQLVGPKTLAEATSVNTKSLFSDTFSTRTKLCRWKDMGGLGFKFSRCEPLEHYVEKNKMDQLVGPKTLAETTSVNTKSLFSDTFSTRTKICRWKDMGGLAISLIAIYSLLDLQYGKRIITAMLKFHGFILILLATIFMPQASAFVDDCQPNQYYDTERLVCLDRCGRDYELICPLQDFCSSNQLWSEHFDPPFCLNRCIKACDKTSYCHHDSALCRPCDTLCDGSDWDACRAYCYDVFITLPTTVPEQPWETCSVYQYYDYDRRVCLDRCGDDNKEQCDVDQFCSTTVPWGVKIRPPACLNHCPHPCGGATYCESTSHQCLPCADLCGDTNTDLCRKHCFDVFMNVTSLDPPTTNHSVSITPTNSPVLSTDIITSVTIYQVTLGVLSAMIIALTGALVMIYCLKRSPPGSGTLFY